MLRPHEAIRSCWEALLTALLGAIVLAASVAAAQLGPPGGGGTTASEGEAAAPADGKEDAPPLPEPEGATRLSEADRVWVDAKNQEVLVDGYVALNKGYLEMFACPQGTKEHESVVAVQSTAATVHAALLAVGAEVGHPARHRPEFVPPAGTEIAIEVRWQDESGTWQTARAQEWVREARSKDEMSQTWVFAGSGFWTDEETGKRYYMAEAGDLICVSNFTTATLDVPFESSQSNEGLMFEAYSERIPKLGTRVRLALKPVVKADAEPTTPSGESNAPQDDGAEPSE